MLKYRENYLHGYIEGSKPVTFSQFNYQDPHNLKTSDIDGTQVGSKNKYGKFTGVNYNLLLNDIKGTRSGSLQKGITSNRHLNPLQPEYVFPGQVELGKGNNPYGTNLKPKSVENPKELLLTVNKNTTNSEIER